LYQRSPSSSIHLITLNLQSISTELDYDTIIHSNTHFKITYIVIEANLNINLQLVYLAFPQLVSPFPNPHPHHHTKSLHEPIICRFTTNKMDMGTLLLRMRIPDRLHITAVEVAELHVCRKIRTNNSGVLGKTKKPLR
jgi:hypothetical protein